MSFGNIKTTTTGAGPQSPESGSQLGDPTNVLPGPYVCIELSSDLMLTISLSIKQTIDATAPATMVHFGISGDISIDGRSKRRCIPQYSAETLTRNLDGGCADEMSQKYKALSMGGNPPMLFDEGEEDGIMGRLFTKSTPKTFVRWRQMGAGGVGLYLAKPTHTYIDPNNQAPKGKLIIRNAPMFQETGVLWKKANLWHQWPGFLQEYGSFDHRFNLEVWYSKNCGPKICYDCPTPPNVALSWSPNCRTRHLVLRAPIDIHGTMPLADWLSDQDAETRRKGYLLFNNPYWYTSRQDPVPQPSQWAQGWNWFDRFIDNTVPTLPVVATEGVGYARYPGFGADIFEGNRQNNISQGLHDIKFELKELLQNAVATWEGGLPSQNPDMFCGNMNLTDAHIDQILGDFQKKWIENSLANDKFNEEPPPVGGNVPGMSTGF